MSFSKAFGASTRSTTVVLESNHSIVFFEYFIGRFPVTNQQYFLFLNSGFEGVQRHIIGWDEHPATKVSWNDAQMYCRWIDLLRKL